MTAGRKWLVRGLAGGMLLIPTMSSVQAQDRGRYYNGMRQGYDGRHGHGYDDRYDRRGHYDQNQGGIGPGKGALIGGAGGAALGALFGGGLKGALIAGGAGAGVGAIAGKVHQDNRQNDWRDDHRH